MSKTWFTSDTHFGHVAVIEYCKRPFSSVEEMDASLIAAWNDVVAPNDVVWHLGDVVFRGDPAGYLDQLHGRIHIILGNHDSPSKLRRTRAIWVGEVKYLRVGGQRIYLSHYAHRTWPRSDQGSFHLYGHSHGDLPGLGRSMDVGVDANGYRPLLLEDVLARLEQESPTYHHVPRERSEWTPS